ncbi:hypothetical protein C0J52_21102 [Blattella germanica]|nr:hypothetical protein C0J52_21102 [Blattella germanica]
MSAASSAPTPNQDFDVASVGSAASGLSTGALQNIREQMAISLSRMRELEEQVKLIPVLQVQLSVLKEEKRQLLLQLRLEEAERNKHNQSSDSVPAVPRRGVQTLMRGRSHSCSEGSENGAVPNGRRSSTRDIGVMCSVMTRELGVSTQQLKVRNAKTNTVNYDMKLGLGKFVAEDIPPVASPMKCISATNTDLLMGQVYSEKELDQHINNAVKMFETTFKSKNDVRNVGIQVESKQEVALLIVEKRDSHTQTENKFSHHDKSNQTEEPKRYLVDVGILVKPQSLSVGLQVKAKTRDVAVSDHVTLDEQCKKCNIKKISIGVGPQEPLILEDSATISLSNIGIFQNKPAENVAIPATKKVSTRSIACNTSVNVSMSRGTDTDDLSVGKKRDFGTNTTKRKLVDAAVGDATTESKSSTNISVCDKCDTEIQNVAKGMLTQNSESSTTSPTVGSATTPVRSVSRIPRPATSASATRCVTPAKNMQEKRRIQRQDTYTKLQVAEKEKEFTMDKSKIDPAAICPAERLLAMQASAAREKEGETKTRLSCSEEDEAESPEDQDNAIMETGLFQPIQQETRQNKEMKAALKVLNDYLRKFPITNVPHHLKNATNIVQQEWFKISSIASANPLDVEDYLDCFEEMSGTLLEYVVNMPDMSGNTAMHYAVSHGNFDVVSILLDSKVCNINRPNAAGYTCVMLVSLAQVRSDTHRQVVRRLFQLADVNVRAKQHGQTALMLAVSHGRLDMVRLLVEAGADMNIQDEDGSTALMCAAEHGHIQIDGSSALNIAMDAGNKDIGVLLYAHEHFSRGSSPYTSLRHRRSKSATPTMLPGTPPSPSPVRERVPRHEQHQLT